MRHDIHPSEGTSRVSEKELQALNVELSKAYFRLFGLSWCEDC